MLYKPNNKPETGPLVESLRKVCAFVVFKFYCFYLAENLFLTKDV